MNAVGIFEPHCLVILIVCCKASVQMAIIHVSSAAPPPHLSTPSGNIVCIKYYERISQTFASLAEEKLL